MATITIKRKTVIIVLSAVLAVIAVAAAAATVIATTRAENGITIVIDAGHGGADGGVTGITTGTKESDINLSIAKYLQKYLKDNGYNAVLTRSDSGAVCGGFKYSKRDDMTARKSAILSAAPDLVISIHCNSYPVSSVKGAQVFYADSSAIGKNTASTVQSYFNDVLNDRPRSAAIGDYYILNCSEYPSVLCECGFLSNPDDESRLITSSYQEKIAYTVYSAVDSIFKEN